MFSPEYLVKVIGVWGFLCPLLAYLQGGWLPAKRYKIGGDGETLSSLAASREWVFSGPWADSADGFSYQVCDKRFSFLQTGLMA
jgi:hypothetical protein